MAFATYHPQQHACKFDAQIQLGCTRYGKHQRTCANRRASGKHPTEGYAEGNQQLR